MPRSSSSAEVAGKRQRVPATVRRDALIDSAVHEFARGGLHGTPVDRIARRVGVAQPYVFALFGSKRELFLAAVERGFELMTATFTAAARTFDPATAPPDVDVLRWMGEAYVDLLRDQRDYLMLQLQSLAACEDPLIREHVRELFATLISHLQTLSGADPERIDDFIRYGMSLNVAAALEVDDLSVTSEWVQAERED